MIIDKNSLAGSILFSNNSCKTFEDYLHIEKNKTIITSGVLLIEIKNPDKQPIDFPDISTLSTDEPINLPKKIVMKLQDAFTKKPKHLQFAILDKKNGSIELTTVDGKSHTLPVEDIDYPDMKKVYPEGKPLAEITLNFNLLKQIIEIIKKVSTNWEGITFKLYGQDKPVRFDFADNGSPKVRGLICPIRT